VVPACNPALRRLRKEDHEFEANLDYTVRLCMRNKTKQNIYLYSKVQIQQNL
jgi:hypothetical protein